ncbi:MAG: ATP-binding cassette domain-containing protein [Mycoplasmatales bacterium]
MNSLNLVLDNYNLVVKDIILLENTNFNIKFNKLILGGRNGTGKSTFLKYIHAGQVMLLNSKDKKATTSFSAQHNVLIEEYTVLSNAKVFRVDLKEFKSLLNIFNKNIDINKKISDLSGGQKQLVNILLALSLKRDVYLLDEPLNNLDHNVKDKFKEYLQKTNKNIIIVSHELIELDNYQKIKIEKRGLING